MLSLILEKVTRHFVVFTSSPKNFIKMLDVKDGLDGF